MLLITKGFGDALRIGYQHRPDIFARQIVRPEMLYDRVVEVTERYTAEGEELIPVEVDQNLRTSYKRLMLMVFDRVRSSFYMAIVIPHTNCK